MIAFGRIDQIFTTVSEQVFLALLAAGRRADLARVHVHAVLALFGEGDVEGDQIVADVVRRVLGQLLLFGAVLVQRGHEVGQRARHAELDLEFAAGEDERVLVRDRHQTEEARRLHRAPLAAGAVRQRHHHRLQVLAHDLELADALELHRLAGQVLARRHRVGEDVQQERSAARRVHSEGHHVTHHRLAASQTKTNEPKHVSKLGRKAKETRSRRKTPIIGTSPA